MSDTKVAPIRGVMEDAGAIHDVELLLTQCGVHEIRLNEVSSIRGRAVEVVIGGLHALADVGRDDIASKGGHLNRKSAVAAAGVEDDLSCEEVGCPGRCAGEVRSSFLDRLPQVLSAFVVEVAPASAEAFADRLARLCRGDLLVREEPRDTADDGEACPPEHTTSPSAMSVPSPPDALSSPRQIGQASHSGRLDSLLGRYHGMRTGCLSHQLGRCSAAYSSGLQRPSSELKRQGAPVRPSRRASRL